MRLLLDTHVFLWYITADPNLPDSFREAIQDGKNVTYLSAASIWEAVIKCALGKLPLPDQSAEYLLRQRERHGIAPLPIEEAVFPFLANLPLLHRDPFDRILIAQSQQHNLTLLTVDDSVKAYPVALLP